MAVVEKNQQGIFVLGIEVKLDHVFFPLPLIDIREQLVSITEFLPEIPEPFQIGRHVWLQDDDGVEWHFLKPIPNEPTQVTQKIHVGLRPRTREDFEKIKELAQQQGLEIVEAFRKRNDDIPRYYLMYPVGDQTAVTEIVGKFN